MLASQNAGRTRIFFLIRESQRFELRHSDHRCWVCTSPSYVSTRLFFISENIWDTRRIIGKADILPVVNAIYSIEGEHCYQCKYKGLCLIDYNIEDYTLISPLPLNEEQTALWDAFFKNLLRPEYLELITLEDISESLLFYDEFLSGVKAIEMISYNNNIPIRSYGDWAQCPHGYKEETDPEERYFMILEAIGSGIANRM